LPPFRIAAGLAAADAMLDPESSPGNGGNLKLCCSLAEDRTDLFSSPYGNSVLPVRMPHGNRVDNGIAVLCSCLEHVECGRPARVPHAL
jgi:hypothetical protein